MILIETYIFHWWNKSKREVDIQLSRNDKIHWLGFGIIKIILYFVLIVYTLLLQSFALYYFSIVCTLCFHNRLHFITFQSILHFNPPFTIVYTTFQSFAYITAQSFALLPFNRLHFITL